MNEAAVLRRFAVSGEVLDVRPHGSGHIHETFAATCADGTGTRRYVLQKLNRHVFPDLERMVENIAAITDHMRATLAARGENADGRSVLQLVRSTSDGFLVEDQGSTWRAYDFVERSYALERPRSPADAEAAATAFARCQELLESYSGPRLFETIARFHDTPHRFATFLAALDRNERGRAAGARPEIDEALANEPLASSLLTLHRAGVLPERITHNDTKLNNVLFDDATGRGLCVTDLDTVMPGLALYDFGDLVRTATSSAAEDEPDPSRVFVRIEMFQAVARGWIAGAALLPAERERLVLAGRLLAYECGVRFLTDHLDGDPYFKIHRPGQNLDRCRSQFALARSLTAHEESLQRWIETLPDGPVRGDA